MSPVSRMPIETGIAARACVVSAGVVATAGACAGGAGGGVRWAESRCAAVCATAGAMLLKIARGSMKTARPHTSAAPKERKKGLGAKGGGAMAPEGTSRKYWRHVQKDFGHPP